MYVRTSLNYTKVIWMYFSIQHTKCTYFYVHVLQLFLNEKGAAVDLMCWMEIEAYRAIPQMDKLLRSNKARQIKSKYICKKYFFGVKSPATKEQQKQVSCICSYVYT